MSARLLNEFAKRHRARLETALDRTLLSYVAMLRLANRGRGTAAPLQDEWTRARERALSDAREGRCTHVDVPASVPALLESRAVIEQRAATLREAHESAAERRALALTKGVPAPKTERIGDANAEAGLLAQALEDARPGLPVFVLTLINGEPRAVLVRA